MKICTKCNVSLDRSAFNKRAASNDGLRPICRECQRSYRDRWATSSKKEDMAAKQRVWYQANKEIRKEYMSAYQEANRSKVRAHSAKRRAVKQQASPPWLTEEHKAAIHDVYWLCQDVCVTTGGLYEVDHIIPLNGENVCGLHVPWNLQVLPMDINRSKSNKTDWRFDLWNM